MVNNHRVTYVLEKDKVIVNAKNTLELRKGSTIRSFYQIYHPLNKLLRKDEKWKWDQMMMTAFNWVKQALFSY